MTGRMSISHGGDEFYSSLSRLILVCEIGPIYDGKRLRHGGIGVDISRGCYRIIHGGSWLAKSIYPPHFPHFCLFDPFCRTATAALFSEISSSASNLSFFWTPPVTFARSVAGKGSYPLVPTASAHTILHIYRQAESAYMKRKVMAHPYRTKDERLNCLASPPPRSNQASSLPALSTGS